MMNNLTATGTPRHRTVEGMTCTIQWAVSRGLALPPSQSESPRPPLTGRRLASHLSAHGAPMHHLITFAALTVPFLCGMVCINAVSHWLGSGE